MEKPLIFDRDEILQTELKSSNSRAMNTMFDIYHAFAKLPDVNGFFLSRMQSQKYGLRYTIDVLVASEAAAQVGFQDRYGSDVRREVMKVIDPFIAAAEEVGEIKPLFGEFVVVGEIADPGKNRVPLRRALRRYEDFAKRAGRGSDIKPHIFIEETPFTPMQEMPAGKLALPSREALSKIEIVSTNRPVAHAINGAIRRIAETPEIHGIVISTVTEAPFLDIVINSDTNPQEVRMAEGSVKATIAQLAQYLENSGENAIPRYGGLVEIPSGSSVDDFKNRYLNFAARSRRRSVEAAFYFPE